MTVCKLCHLPLDSKQVRCTCKLTARERTLPIWAQNELNELRYRILLEADRRRQLSSAYQVLQGRDWFTLRGPRPEDDKPIRYLYWDICNPACSLGPDDVLLIGRATRETPK